ncbi:armadillo-type protein [Mycena capillaripes]|nr:armadillo-type protein [Mycena capillaripes]
MLKPNPFAQLFSLLNDEHSWVVENALNFLANAAMSQDGAEAIVLAEAGPKPSISRTQRSCGSESQPLGAGCLFPESYLVSLSHANPRVVEHAINAVANAAQWQDGAKAAIQAKVQDHLLKLLESPNVPVRESASRLVRNLVRHEVTAATLLEINHYELLVSCFNDGNPVVVESAINALASAAQQQDGAEAVVRDKVLDWVLELLEFSNPVARKSTCRLVRNLALHEATVSKNLEVKPCPRLASLLQAAISALAKISQWSDGAAALVGLGTEFTDELNTIVAGKHIHIIQKILAQSMKESEIPETTDL